VVSFVSNVQRVAGGLVLRVFDTYGSNRVVRTAGRQIGQLAGQVTGGLQVAGVRASAAVSGLRGGGLPVNLPNLPVNGAPVKDVRVKGVAHR
jgi:hypothetical protein